MVKKLESPFEKFPGYITIPDPLTYPDFITYRKMRQSLVDIKDGEEKEIITKDPFEVNYIVAKHLFPLILEWSIDGIEQDAEKFPCTGTDYTLRETNDFINWIAKEFSSLVNVVTSEKKE